MHAVVGVPMEENTPFQELQMDSLDRAEIQVAINDMLGVRLSDEAIAAARDFAELTELVLAAQAEAMQGVRA
ncbi:hypothetical protein KK483_01660 [Streptomyces sp. FIT100]|nr:hypothetical protein KK483_01660 [Streptomyces sp. FIT100]